MTNRRGFGDTPSRRAILTGASAGAAAAFVPFPKPAIAQPAHVRYTLSWLPIGQYAALVGRNGGDTVEAARKTG